MDRTLPPGELLSFLPVRPRLDLIDADCKIVLAGMEELLNQYMGKKVDVSVGTTAVYRGNVIDVRNGILYLRDDDGKVAHIAVDKIAVVYECSDSSSRPGFVI